MALTSFSGSSQVALSPRPTVLSVALARSDASLDDETQRTVSAFGRYRSEVQGRLAAQAEEIRQLRALLVAANARPRELTIAHEEKMSMAQARIEVLERRAVAAEQERDAATRLGTEAETARAQEAIRAAELQQEAVAARAETATIRRESAQQMATALAERNAAIAAERQRGDALVAAERQTTEEMRVRHLLLEAGDTRKIEKFIRECTQECQETRLQTDRPSPRRVKLLDIKPVSSLLKNLQTLIDERLAR